MVNAACKTSSKYVLIVRVCTILVYRAYRQTEGTHLLSRLECLLKDLELSFVENAFWSRRGSSERFGRRGGGGRSRRTFAFKGRACVQCCAHTVYDA